MLLVVIKPVTHDKDIWDNEPHVIDLDGALTLRGFVQQNTSPQRSRAKTSKLVLHNRKSIARVQYVVHKKHIAVFDINAQRLGMDKSSAFCAFAVT